MGNLKNNREANIHKGFCKHLHDTISSADISGIHQLRREACATHSSLQQSLWLVAFGADRPVNSSGDGSLFPKEQKKIVTTSQEYLCQSTKGVHTKSFQKSSYHLLLLFISEPGMKRSLSQRSWVKWDGWKSRLGLLVEKLAIPSESLQKPFYTKKWNRCHVCYIGRGLFLSPAINLFTEFALWWISLL